MINPHPTAQVDPEHFRWHEWAVDLSAKPIEISDMHNNDTPANTPDLNDAPEILPQKPIARSHAIIKIMIGVLAALLILPMWFDISASIQESGIGGAIRAKFFLMLLAYVGAPLFAAIMIFWGIAQWRTNGANEKHEYIRRPVLSVSDFFTTPETRDQRLKNICFFLLKFLVLSVLMLGAFIGIADPQ